MTTPTPNRPRGFALLSADKQRAASSAGGRAAQAEGRAHQWNRKQASAAARHSAEVRGAPWWDSSEGGVSLRVIYTDAVAATPAGSNDAAIAALAQRPYIARQLARITPQAARAALHPYGAWSEYELRDHAANCRRLLWIACGEIAEDAK